MYIYISSFCQDRWHSASWRDAMDRRQQIPTENRALINPQLSGQNCGSTLEYPWRIFGIFGMEPFFWVKGCQSEAVPMACTGVEYVHASEWWKQQARAESYAEHAIMKRQSRMVV